MRMNGKSGFCKMKKLVYLFLAILPGRLKVKVYNAMGHDVHPSARIGLSYVEAGKIILGPGASIGHFNVIRNIERLEMGAQARIGSQNYISAVPLHVKSAFQASPQRFPALVMEENSGLVGRNYLDCNDTIKIGAFTIVAGLGVCFFTHGINIKTNAQEAAKVTIGRYCMIAARCVITKGAVLPDYCVLGANSTLHKAFTEEYTLYSGVPALPVRTYDSSCAYFNRDTRYVS